MSAPAISPAPRERDLNLLVAVVLLLAAFAVFYQVLGFDFVYDDRFYILEKDQVHQGITWESVRWALTKTSEGSWHPTLWLLYITVYEFFGLNAQAFHGAILLLHMANTLLLFFLLFRLTRARMRSAFVAGLFALHPLHVESTAFVTGATDVLCFFFWLLALHAYARWTGSKRFLWYGLCFGAYVLSCMSKAMAVTFPVTLLLLDFWPLGRFPARTGPPQGGKGESLPASAHGPWATAMRLVLEKIPFFLLALVPAVMAVLARQGAGSLVSTETVTTLERLQWTCVNYTHYLKKLFLPCNLAHIYPRGELPGWPWIGISALVLLCITGMALWGWRRAPFLAVGWLWYAATLSPVSGLVQYGYYAVADRYTYIPYTGLFVILAWGAHALASRLRHGPGVAAVPGLAALAALAVVSHSQAAHWKNPITLNTHTVAVTENNGLALSNLAASLLEAGRPEEAIPHFQAVLELNADNPKALRGLGQALAMTGRWEPAKAALTRLLALEPDNADAYNDLGIIAFQTKDLEGAKLFFQKALELAPGHALAKANLRHVETMLDNQ